MSATGQPSEEELRAAYEAEIKQIGVDQVLIEQVVTLINLGMRRTGLQPGTEDERDPAQVRTAVEAVRALLPLVEQAAGPQAAPIREALTHRSRRTGPRIRGRPRRAPASRSRGAARCSRGAARRSRAGLRIRVRRATTKPVRRSAADGCGCPANAERQASARRVDPQRGS
jgi:hypothetical protein